MRRQQARHDWIPDRAIGPTEDSLYDKEKDYNDQQLSAILSKPLTEISKIITAEKRAVLMKHRKEELRELIAVYYSERGWSKNGIPKVETLKQIGLWNFLSDEARTKVTAMNGQ